MAVAPDRLRNALSRFATGVTVVSVNMGQRLHGMTASSFASVSLEPPLVLVSLATSSRTHPLVIERESFAVNILAAGQAPLARAFAGRGEKPFDSLAHHPSDKHGHPVFDEALAWLECTVWQVVRGGDHDIVIGEVIDCGSRDGRPLLYFDRSYRSLNGDLNER